MQASKDLQSLLRQHLAWHATRLDFAARFILALIHTKTVNLVDISLDLNAEAKQESNYRRIQRFFKDFTVDQLVIARLMLLLLPTRNAFVVVMDRTNWRFGKLDINILMIAIAHNGIAFPVVWTLLPKAGNSNTKERIELMERFLRVVTVKDIHSFLADREFVGQDWFAYLLAKRIPFHIRVRQDALCDGWFNAFLFFQHLPVGQSKCLHHRYLIFGHPLAVTGVRLADDYLVIVTNTNPKHSLARYTLRWRIESFFAAIKVTGFDVEATHLNKVERIDKLFSLVAIAFCWAHLVGEQLHDSGAKRLRRKTHGRQAKSFFRHGLDHLRCVLNHLHVKYADFTLCLCVFADGRPGRGESFGDTGNPTWELSHSVVHHSEGATPQSSSRTPPLIPNVRRRAWPKSRTPFSASHGQDGSRRNLAATSTRSTTCRQRLAGAKNASNLGTNGFT